MAVKHMTRTALSYPTTVGALYQEEVTLEGATESDVFLFPFTRVTGIALDLEGDGTIEISNSLVSKLEASQGKFVSWDGVSTVNNAVVAFKVVGNSGTVSAVISVKTDTV